MSRLGKVLERSVKAQIESLDVNFNISNEDLSILDAELTYVVLKLRKKMQFYQLKQNVFEES